MADSIRIKRLERLALQRAAEVVNYELADPRVHLITLTRVKLSKDLSFADIYWSILGTDGDRTKAGHALKSAAAVVQREIGEAFQTRRTPRVRFHFDESIAGAIHVSQILDELAEERAEREGAGEDAGDEKNVADATDSPSDDAV